MQKFVLTFLAGCAVMTAVLWMLGRIRTDSPSPPAKPELRTPTVAVPATAPAVAAPSSPAAPRPKSTVAGTPEPRDGVEIVPQGEAMIRCRLVMPAGVPASSHVVAWWNGTHADSEFAGGVLTIHVTPGAGHASFQVTGCVVVKRSATAVAGGVVDWGEMTLTAAATLVGRVADPEGNAVAAFVYPRAGAASMPLAGTDEAGGFSFDGLPYGDVELRVEGKGFVARKVVYPFSAAAKPAFITVVRGGGVRGMVLDADGLPAPKVIYVEFVDRDDPKNRDRMGFPNVDEDGGFEVHLLPGHYRAITTLGDRRASADIDVAEGETSELTLRLR
jgi:hypothetical protein